MAASSPGWRKDFANNSKQKSALWFDYSQEAKDRFRQSLHLIPEPARSSEITSTNTGPELKKRGGQGEQYLLFFGCCFVGFLGIREYVLFWVNV